MTTREETEADNVMRRKHELGTRWETGIKRNDTCKTLENTGTRWETGINTGTRWETRITDILREKRLARH